MSLKKKEVSVVILVDKNNQVLILKRSPNAPSYPGYWNFPGGGVDSGESPKQAAARELMEESGIEINLADLIYMSENSTPHLNIHYFLAKYNEDPVSINRESTHYKWVNIEDLNNLKMIPMSTKMIDDIQYYIGVLYET